MKGMVFTEFYSLVESLFGEDMVDDIIEDAQLENDGAYTAVGTYNHEDLVKMVVALSKRSGTPVNELVKAFGIYLFSRFSTMYPRFFEGVTDTFQFLTGIDDIIHAEVLKLYPDANLPKFEVTQEGDTLVMVYTSQRHFEDLAEGLIEGAGKHFGDELKIQRKKLSEDSMEFRVTR